MNSVQDRKKARRRSTQRELVLNAITDGNHPTARTIFEDVSIRSQISFGTVYRNLQILVEDGTILQIQTDSSAHYDKRTEPHYHLHCVRCCGVFDIPLEYRGELDEDARALGAGVIESHSISFRGLCADCAAQENV